MMTDNLPLRARYLRLLDFAHSRTEPALSDAQVAERSGVALSVLSQIREGSIVEIDAAEATAIATSLGLLDGSYLHAPLANSVAMADVQVMHEKLEMYIEARSLGVERIAARDITQSAGLVGRVRDHLRVLSHGDLL